MKFQFMRDVMSYNPESGASAKRFVLIIAGVALSISTIILSSAAVYGVEVASSLWAVTTALAGLAGVSYVGKKDGHPAPEADKTMLTEDSK